MSALDAVRRWLRAPLVSALFVTFALRSLLGWLIALPVLGAVAASGVGALPEGDRALFQAPGYWLLELLLRNYRSLGAAVRVSALLWLVALVVRVLGTALLFAVSAAPQAPLSTSAARAVRCVRRFIAIGVLELLVALVLLLVVSALMGVARPSRIESEMWASLPPALMALCGGLLLGLAALFFDGARAAAVELRLRDSLREAASLLRARGVPLAARYFLLLSAGALAVAVAARLTEALDLSRAGALRVAAVVGLHQGTLLALSALEVLWVTALSRSARP